MSTEMSGPQHYREAERLLGQVKQTSTEFSTHLLATAQVHATLALVAATAYPAVRDYWGDEDPDTPREWTREASS